MDLDLTNLSKKDYDTLTTELCNHFPDRVVLKTKTYDNKNAGKYWFIQINTSWNDYDVIHYEVIYDAVKNKGKYANEGVRVELHLEWNDEKRERKLFEYLKEKTDESKWERWVYSRDGSHRYIVARNIKNYQGVVNCFNELIKIFDEIILQYKRIMITEAVKLLKRKHNLILAGAPGVGKTYNTAAIALKVLGEDVDFDKHDAVMERYKALQDQKRIFFTTFHQSMDYEDFVEGMKPNVEDGYVTYKIEDGIFKQACKAVHSNIEDCIDDYINKIKGWENKRVIPTKTGNSSIYVWLKGKSAISVQSVNSMSERDDSIASLNIKEVKERALKGENFKCDHHSAYIDAFVAAVKQEYGIKEQEKTVVLIIDEINRGNVSKIFGELITLIEVDKREWGEDESNGKHPIEVMLPYSKESFSVPSNLYIIGTMNTTDRSTGTLDYALRRRFAFYTLKSDVNVVKGHYTSNDKLGGKAVALFENIEKFIISKSCGDYDVDDLMVGHSYFMAKDEDELRDKMKYEVIPLIREYINDGILNVSRDEAKKYTDEWCKLNVVEIKETQQKQEGEGNKSDLDRGGEPASSDTADTEQQNVEDNG